MRKFKVGDLVKMDLDSIIKHNNNGKIFQVPIWYSNRSFTVKKFSYMNSKLITDTIFIYEDGGDNNFYGTEITEIWCEYLMFDIMAIRRKKLEQLGMMSLIDTEVN